MTVLYSSTRALNQNIDYLQRRMAREDEREQRRLAAAERRRLRPTNFSGPCLLPPEREELLRNLHRTAGARAIIDGVCKKHDVHITWIMSNARMRKVSWARQEA